MNRLPTFRQNGSALTLLLAAIILLVILAIVLPKLLGSATPDTASRTSTPEQQALQQAASAARTLSQDHTADALAAAEGDHPVPTSNTSDNNTQMSGEGIARTRCLSCHAANSIMPHTPRLGNVADWAPLLQKGKKALVDNAYNGYVNPNGGVMPPKGGDASLSRAEVEAAVVYLANQSGGQF